MLDSFRLGFLRSQWPSPHMIPAGLQAGRHSDQANSVQEACHGQPADSSRDLNLYLTSRIRHDQPCSRIWSRLTEARR